ncbi:MAG: hypothetical protein HoeaKO_39530 [Hoeflea alexandrii]
MGASPLSDSFSLSAFGCDLSVVILGLRAEDPMRDVEGRIGGNDRAEAVLFRASNKKPGAFAPG